MILQLGNVVSMRTGSESSVKGSLMDGTELHWRIPPRVWEGHNQHEVLETLSRFYRAELGTLSDHFTVIDNHIPFHLLKMMLPVLQQ